MSPLENIHILVFWVDGYQRLEGAYSFHLQEILHLIYCRWRQYIPLKHWYQPNGLHTIITKNNTICSASPTAVQASNVTYNSCFIKSYHRHYYKDNWTLQACNVITLKICHICSRNNYNAIKNNIKKGATFYLCHFSIITSRQMYFDKMNIYNLWCKALTIFSKLRSCVQLPKHVSTLAFFLFVFPVQGAAHWALTNEDTFTTAETCIEMV
jgi:hypothetical protein